MSLLGCLAITEGYIVAYLLPPFYRKKVTLSVVEAQSVQVIATEVVSQKAADVGEGSGHGESKQ